MKYDVDLSEVGPSKYYTLGALSYTLLANKILSKLDEDQYSLYNIQKVVAEPLEESKRNCSLTRIEYESGVARSFKLHGRMRIFSVLVGYITDMMKLRGSRGKHVPLRQSFNTEIGVYRHVVFHNFNRTVHKIIHTHTGSDKFVPLDKVPVPYTNSESNLCLENKPQ